jgi:hypothetical protein
MTDLAQLEATADEKRLRLTRTLRSIEKRATLSGLADSVIARTGGAPRSGEIVEALRRNPILAVGLALCAGLLVFEVSKVRKLRMLNGRHRHTVPARTDK